MQCSDKPPPYSSLVVPQEQDRPPAYSSDDPPPAFHISIQRESYIQVGSLQNRVGELLIIDSMAVIMSAIPMWLDL